jgi:hypothetical protein
MPVSVAADPTIRSLPFELSAAAMRAMADAVVARCVDHIASLPQQPLYGVHDAETLCLRMREPAPDAGSPLEPLLDDLFGTYIPQSFTTPSPGYLAYIPGGGLYSAALADFITNTVNRYTGIWQAAPALVQLEANALEWLREWMGFPDTTRGLFTTGGSMATFNAVLCAREKYLGPDIRRGVLYTSDQAHHCVIKSAKLAGIMPDRVRCIPADAQFHLPMAALREAIADDRRNHQHGCRRSARRDRRSLRRGESLAPCGWRVRRVLPAVRRHARGAARPRSRRLADARSAQGHVHAVRHRGVAGTRWRRVACGA